ncbi:MAG: hypothetical protein AAF449_09715, partial [Myxococcota bacterium]
PFFSEDARRIAAHGSMPPLRQDVPSDVVDIVRWACHPSLKHRCPSALEFAKACESALLRTAGASAESVLFEWLRQLRPSPPVVDKARLAEVFLVAPTGLDSKTGVARFRTMSMQAYTAVAHSVEQQVPTTVAPVADPALATEPAHHDHAADATISVPADGDDEQSVRDQPYAQTAGTDSKWLDVDFSEYEPLQPLDDTGRVQLTLARPQTPQKNWPALILLKVWPAVGSPNLQLVALLSREAALRRELADPHLPRVHEVWVDRGRIFVAAAYCPGRSLEEVVSKLKRSLSVEEVAAVGLGVVAGLMATRRIHRALGSDFRRVPCEVQPSLVYITFDGRTVLNEFIVWSASERMSDGHWVKSTPAVAHRRELWSVVSNLDALMVGNQDPRAQALRTKMAAVLESGLHDRMLNELQQTLASASGDTVRVLRTMIDEAFGETAETEWHRWQQLERPVDASEGQGLAEGEADPATAGLDKTPMLMMPLGLPAASPERPAPRAVPDWNRRHPTSAALPKRRPGALSLIVLAALVAAILSAILGSAS